MDRTGSGRGAGPSGPIYDLTPEVVNLLRTAGSLDELAKGTEAAILQNKTLRADIRRLVEDSCRAVKLPADVLHRSEEDIAKEIEKRVRAELTGPERWRPGADAENPPGALEAQRRIWKAVWVELTSGVSSEKIKDLAHRALCRYVQINRERSLKSAK